MQEVIAAFLSGSTKRVVGALLAIATIVLHNKFGIALSDTEIAMIGAIAVAWITQSGLNAAKQKGLDAASALTMDTAGPALEAVVAKTSVSTVPAPASLEEAMKVIADLTAKLKAGSAVVLLCVAVFFHSSPVFAQDAGSKVVADAPHVSFIKLGDPSPVDGVIMEQSVYIATARALVALDAQNEALKKSNISWEMCVGVAVLGLLVGGAVGAGAAYAATHPAQR